MLIEVKGGCIDHDGPRGQWTTTNRHGDVHPIDPFNQVKKNMYDLLNKIKSLSGWAHVAAALALVGIAGLAAYAYQGRAVVHSLPLPAPVPLSPTVIVPAGGGNTAPSRVFVTRFGPHGWETPGTGLPVPLSLLRQKGDWTLYTRLVNHVTCAATAGAAGAEETWVGTGGGIKRLDAQGRLLKLYTDGDGLPSNGIVALAAEPKEAWCVTVADRAPYVYSLCRLDRATDRWEVLRQVPVPSVPCTDQTSADSFIAAAPHSVCFVLGNVARSRSGIVAFVLDRATRAWQDAAWDASPQPGGCFSYAEPYWAYAASGQGGDSLYVGTPEGLARYRIADRRWDRYLPDHAVVGGAPATGGGLWLATLTKTDTNLIPATATLHMLRFETGKEVVTADYEQIGASTGAEAGGNDRLTFLGTAATVVDDGAGAVWLAGHRAGGFFRSQDPLATPLLRLDTVRRGWQAQDTSLASTAAALPLPVLRAALLAGYALPTPTLLRRLPGWSSPAASLPVDAAAVPGQEPPPQIPDPDGSVWSVADRKVLTRTTGGKTERFPPPALTLSLTPQTWLTAMSGGVLYALTSDSLWMKRLPDRAWTPHPLPPGVTRPYTGSLISLGGRLWLVTDHLWSWDSAAAQWHASTPTPGEFLGADASGFWFQRDRGAVLYHVKPGVAVPEILQVNTFRQDHNTSGFVGFAGGLAWFSVQEGVVQTGDTLFYGYDPQTKIWGPHVSLPGHVQEFSLREGAGSVYVTVVQRLNATGEAAVGDTYRFSLKTRLWETIAPTVPPAPNQPYRSFTPDHLRLAAVGDQSLWLVDTTALTAWRWDRARHVWTYEPVTGEERIEGTDGDGAVAGQGGVVYTATQDGVWRLDTKAGHWASLPMPLSGSGSLTLRPCSVDGGGVWAFAYGSRRQTFAARFDKARHTWKLWDARSGFPETGEPTDIASDGISALTMTYRFGAYRLDPKTDHWQDVSPALATALTSGRSDTDLFARNLRSDPPGIWVRASGYWNAKHTGKSNALPPVPPLAHWDGARGRFEPFPPHAGTDDPYGKSAFWSDSFLVTPRAAWLPAREGLWRLDKAARTWRFLPSPAGFPSPVEDLQQTPDGALWLCGRDSIARLSPEAAH